MKHCYRFIILAENLAIRLLRRSHACLVSEIPQMHAPYFLAIVEGDAVCIMTNSTVRYCRMSKAHETHTFVLEHIVCLFVCKTLCCLFFFSSRFQIKHEGTHKQLGVRGATGVLLRGIASEVVGRRAIGLFIFKFVEIFDFGKRKRYSCLQLRSLM